MTTHTHHHHYHPHHQHYHYNNSPCNRSYHEGAKRIKGVVKVVHYRQSLLIQGSYLQGLGVVGVVQELVGAKEIHWGLTTPLVTLIVGPVIHTDNN